IDVASIRKKRDLLTGICAEAVELLRGRPANAVTFGQLRKVRPMRQIEMAELMCASSNFSVSYAKCLDRKSTRLNSSHVKISYAARVFTLSLHDALPIY